MPVIKYIDPFLHYLSGIKNVSEHTLRCYESDLRGFFSHSGGKFSKDKIREYIAYLHEKGRGKRTRSRKLSSLRSFGRYLLSEGIIVENPALEVSSPKLDRPLPSCLSYDQVQQLLELPDLTTYLGLRDRTIFEVLYATGMRISELCALSRFDLSLREGVVKAKGKGKKERTIPLTKLSCEWLGRYLKDAKRYIDSPMQKKEADPEAVFLNRWGGRLTTRSIQRSFQHYKKQLGIIGKLTPHTMRHTIATHLLENGMDLKTIGEVLGHASLGSTTIYTNVSTALKKRAYQKHHPLEEGEGNQVSTVSGATNS